MKPRVLFVDDDPMLLASMQRCLGMQFDMAIAESGPEALRIIDSGAVFSVIVTDMRMPVMNGVEFIERARAETPHSVFLMLTGNQDVQTAVQAVNEGGVARFLNKPCDPSDIAEAIEFGHRQFEYEASERELLNKTLVGALGLFTDVLEIVEPELLGRVARTEQYAEQLGTLCGIATTWEYKIAGKLIMVGFALQKDPPAPSENPSQQLARLAAASASAAKMAERIPRLAMVAQIVREVPATEGDLPVLEPRGEGDVVRIGAALLRVAQHVESMSHLGLDIDQADHDLRRALPKAYEPLLAAAREVYPANAESQQVSVTLAELRPGMILSDNLARTDGAILLRAGRRLSETHIEKLNSDSSLQRETMTVPITKASFEAAGLSTAVVE